MAYYRTASAQEVVKWYQDHGELLFSRNIRGALVGTDVNDGIITTAREDPSRFWFFNNGVTVIAESFEQAPYVNQKSGNFNFRRANVINGAQTVSTPTAPAGSLRPFQGLRPHRRHGRARVRGRDQRDRPGQARDQSDVGGHLAHAVPSPVQPRR